MKNLRLYDGNKMIHSFNYRNIDYVLQLNGSIVGKFNGKTYDTVKAVIMLNTGLKDKKGVYIFDGDILSDTIDGIISYIPVFWCEKTAQFVKDISYSKDGSFTEPLHENINQYEIKGNIHEHIKLLINEK